MKLYIPILLLGTLLFVGCKVNIKPDATDRHTGIIVHRYDQIEYRYLTTGDFAALQQMSTEYPNETRTLIEDVLQLGSVEERDINNRLLTFYQDTLLQSLITDAEAQYADMSDINDDLTVAFNRLRNLVPDIHIPYIYSQIGALDQSVIVGNNIVGISLDKYLGEDYPLYKRYYTPAQRHAMTRENIVPDCLSFYLISCFPIDENATLAQKGKDLHMSKIMWTVNKAVGKIFFNSKYIDEIDYYMRNHPQLSVKDFLKGEMVI